MKKVTLVLLAIFYFFSATPVFSETPIITEGSLCHGALCYDNIFPMTKKGILIGFIIFERKNSLLKSEPVTLPFDGGQLQYFAYNTDSSVVFFTTIKSREIFLWELNSKERKISFKGRLFAPK